MLASLGKRKWLSFLTKSYKTFSKDFILTKIQARKFTKSNFSSRQTSYPAIHLPVRQNNFQNSLPKTHQQNPQQRQLKKVFWVYLFGNKSISLVHIECSPLALWGSWDEKIKLDLDFLWEELLQTIKNFSCKDCSKNSSWTDLFYFESLFLCSVLINILMMNVLQKWLSERSFAAKIK